MSFMGHLYSVCMCASKQGWHDHNVQHVSVHISVHLSKHMSQHMSNRVSRCVQARKVDTIRMPKPLARKTTAGRHHF